MVIGMMPMGTFVPNYAGLGMNLGNRTTSYNFNQGNQSSSGIFSTKMDWSFLNYSAINTGSSFNLNNTGGSNWLTGFSMPNFSCNFSMPNFNFTPSIGLTSGLSFANKNNPFANNSLALQQFFGIVPPPIYNVQQSCSFGSITSGGASSNNSFVPTSDYAENAARVAEQEEAKGVRETSKNDSVDIRRYKNGAKNSHQWCAYFTSYCFGAGQNKKPIFGFTGSSQHIRRQAEKAGVFAKKDSGYVPKRGDIAIWTNIGDPAHGHVGVVTKVYSDGSFDVIEGNSSNRVKKNHYKSPTSVSKRFAGFCKTSEWAK